LFEELALIDYLVVSSFVALNPSESFLVVPELAEKIVSPIGPQAIENTPRKSDV
jgi:hypothetical protein